MFSAKELSGLAGNGVNNKTLSKISKQNPQLDIPAGGISSLFENIPAGNDSLNTIPHPTNLSTPLNVIPRNIDAIQVPEIKIPKNLAPEKPSFPELPGKSLASTSDISVPSVPTVPTSESLVSAISATAATTVTGVEMVEKTGTQTLEVVPNPAAQIMDVVGNLQWRIVLSTINVVLGLTHNYVMARVDGVIQPWAEYFRSLRYPASFVAGVVRSIRWTIFVYLITSMLWFGFGFLVFLVVQGSSFLVGLLAVIVTIKGIIIAGIINGAVLAATVRGKEILLRKLFGSPTAQVIPGGIKALGKTD